MTAGGPSRYARLDKSKKMVSFQNLVKINTPNPDKPEITTQYPNLK